MTAIEDLSYWEYWYDIVDGSVFRQGDIFRDVPMFSLRGDDLSDSMPKDATEQRVVVNVVPGNWIILDPSCDLDQNNCDQVLMASIKDATQETLKTQTKKEFKQRLEVIRRGGYETRFLLAEYPKIDHPFPVSFVDFRGHALAPIGYLRRISERPRLRLRSPHRERFGNWAAACLSRVGPETKMLIPPFIASIHDPHGLTAMEDEDATGPDRNSPAGPSGIWARFSRIWRR